MNKRSDTIVLGIGNNILMDDGIGIFMIERLLADYPRDDVDYQSGFMGGLDLLDIVRDYSSLILIDAIKTENGIAGTVYSFTPANFKETLHLSNIHDTSFLTALKLGRHMGINLPEKINILAIEIVEDRIFGTDFSPAITEKLDVIYNDVKNNIAAILEAE